VLTVGWDPDLYNFNESVGQGELCAVAVVNGMPAGEIQANLAPISISYEDGSAESGEIAIYFYFLHRVVVVIAVLAMALSLLSFFVLLFCFSGSDYVASPSDSVTFNSTSGNRLCTTVAIIQDAPLEMERENFFAVLADSSDSRITISPARAEVGILDDDSKFELWESCLKIILNKSDLDFI